jgi:hypothetical protein
VAGVLCGSFFKTPAGGLSTAGVISTGVRLIGELHHRLYYIYDLHYFIKRNLSMNTVLMYIIVVTPSGTLISGGRKAPAA